MGWKDWPYWLRGGILSLGIIPLVSIVFLFLVSPLLGANDDTLLMLFPFVFVAALGLGMRGSAPALPEVILTLGIALILTLAVYFAIGALFGYIYGQARNRTLALTFMIIIPLALVTLISYYNGYSSYQSYDSLDECTFSLSMLRKTYDKDECLMGVAVHTNDPQLCLQITKDYKLSECLLLVAQESHEYTACDLIPAEDWQKGSCYSGVAQYRGECEVVNSTVSRDYCYWYLSDSLSTAARQDVCHIFKTEKNRQLCTGYQTNLAAHDLCAFISNDSIKAHCLQRAPGHYIDVG